MGRRGVLPMPSRQPRSVEGDVGHRALPYRSARRARRALREVLAHRHRLQLLPQPALPEVSGSGSTRVAGRARGRAIAGADLLFKASSETVLTIAADPKHLGACIGILSVLHTWGSAMTHHPHVHMIVPGGGFSLRWQELGLLPASLLAVSGLAVSLVPRLVPGQAPCRLPGGCAAVLRQASSRKRQTIPAPAAAAA
jgi:Putative transposase